jgi:hypothetical protein
VEVWSQGMESLVTGLILTWGRVVAGVLKPQPGAGKGCFWLVVGESSPGVNPVRCNCANTAVVINSSGFDLLAANGTITPWRLHLGRLEKSCNLIQIGVKVAKVGRTGKTQDPPK